MTDDERRMLIRYHAKLMVKWVDHPHLAAKQFLAEHAERALSLINELEEK